MDAMFHVGGSEKGAFDTLKEALEAARAYAGKANVRILVHGTLRLTETLVIDGGLFNRGGFGITVEGAAGAVISGGRKLEGFEKWREGVYRARVEGVDRVRHLYVDGKAAPRPRTQAHMPHRWEKLEAEDFAFHNLLGEYDVGDRGVVRNFEGIATTRTEMLSWRNVRDMELVFETGWTHCIVPIRDVARLDDGRALIYPAEPCFRTCQLKEGVQIGACPNYIENVFEHLEDRPGQWYYDRAEKMLYLSLSEGDTPEQHEIVLPVLETLVSLEGELSGKPSGFAFKNLAFMHSTYLRPATEGHPEVQANVLQAARAIDEKLSKKLPLREYEKVPSALRVRACRGVSFEDCRFANLGSGAIDIECGAEDTLVTGCEFSNIAGSALQIGDFDLADAHPIDKREIVRKAGVCDCYIHHTGFDYKGSVAVLVGYAQDVTVAHNEIACVPYTAVSIGWGWALADMTMDDRINHLAPPDFPRWTEPSAAKRNRVLYNHIHHAMTLLCDGGAVYTLGQMEGSAIIGNLIHESAGFHGEGYEGFDVSGIESEEIHDPAVDPFRALHGGPGGIYMDEGSAGIEVRENVLYDIAIPLHYHNQILGGYKKVTIEGNTLNKRPGDAGYPQEAADFAGLTFGRRHMLA